VTLTLTPYRLLFLNPHEHAYDKKSFMDILNPTLRARRQKASKNMVLSSNKHL